MACKNKEEFILILGKAYKSDFETEYCEDFKTNWDIICRAASIYPEKDKHGFVTSSVINAIANNIYDSSNEYIKILKKHK